MKTYDLNQVLFVFVIALMSIILMLGCGSANANNTQLLDTVRITEPNPLPKNWESDWVKDGEYFRLAPEESKVYMVTKYRPRVSVYEIFLSGGVLYMSLITLCLVGVLLAAWKMPSRVAILGRMALIIGVGSFMIGVYQACSALQQAPDISPTVMFGGIKVALIAPLWASIVYFVSLVVRLIQKPNTI